MSLLHKYNPSECDGHRCPCDCDHCMYAEKAEEANRKEEKMTVRQWLGRARFIDREINALERQLQKARDDAIRITQNYDSDGAQSSKDPHKFDRIAEFMGLIREKYQEAYIAKDEITKAIFELEDVRLRTALFNYYVNLMTWEECAVSMHYQWSRMMDIRRMALEAIEPIVKKHLL